MEIRFGLLKNDSSNMWERGTRQSNIIPKNSRKKTAYKDLLPKLDILAIENN